MDDAMQVRAAVLGMNPLVYERMEMFDLTKDDAGALREFSVEGLQQAIGDGLAVDTIIRHVRMRTITSEDDLRAWATLTKLLSKEQLAKLDDKRRFNKMCTFMEADFNVDDALALSENGGIWDLKNAVAARKEGIALTDLVEAWAVHYDSSYVDARMAGATHAELLELLQLTANVASDFGLDNYIAVTTKGIAAHEQIVDMLHAHDQPGRRHYLEFVLGTNEHSGTVGHQEAMEILASKYSSPSNYWRARSVSPHGQVVEIAQTGMRSSEYVALRQNNPRVTHKEIVRLASLGGNAPDLPNFTRLIDEGYPYADIKQAGMSVSDYHYLRMSEYGPRLTQAQTLEVAGLRLSPFQYCELRQKGTPHDIIVANSQ